MLRLLRRYNKWILVIGGTLLMIAFLIPEAIQRLSQQAAFLGGTWARTHEGEVTGADELRLRDEMRIIGMLGDGTLGLDGFSRDPIHWYLLQLEATRAGLVGGPSDGLRSLQQMEMAEPDGPTVDFMLAQLAGEAQVSGQVVLETLAKLNGVMRLMGLYDRSPKLSDRRVVAAAREMLSTVDTDMVVIDARRLSEASAYSPTEEELEAHLAEFGAANPGSEPYGFGYRLPDRVRIEWLTVPGSTIRRSVAASDRLSNIELIKHRERNRDLFPSIGADADDFESVREQVREHLLGLLAQERFDEIAKFLSDQMALPQRGIPRQGPFLILPDDWSSRRGNMEALAQATADQFRIDLPIYRTSGSTMIEPSRIDTLPDLANASTDRVGTTPKRPAELVAEAKELGGSDLFAVQAGVTLPIFRTPADDLVLVRILDADASRAPHGVDEVRDKLIDDLRALRTYKDLVDRLDSLRADALRDGLVSFARGFDTTVQSTPRLRGADPQFLQFGFRMPPSLPGLGQSPVAIRKIFDAALALPYGVPASSLPDEERTVAFGVDRRLSAVVARITNVVPLTAEEFALVREDASVQRTVLNEELAELRERLFSRDAMIERHGFVLMREPEEEDDFDWEEDDDLVAATTVR